MTTKLLALSLGVAMLSGVGIASAETVVLTGAQIASAETVVLTGAQSKAAAQSKMIRLTDKQMDAVTAGKRKSSVVTSPVITEPILICSTCRVYAN